MRILLLFVVVLIASVNLRAEGIEFFHGSWEEALAEAESQNKIIFVDAYTTWCGPCKRMAAQVFPDAAVGEFYNANFISVKLDMEKEESVTFRQKFPVSAYPTLFYIDYDGTLVKKVRGAQSVEKFLAAGESALNEVDRSGQYVERYEAGDRSPELMYEYVKALNQAGKNSSKVVNEYLREQKDLTTPENLRFLSVAPSTVDSRAFTLLIEHRKAVIAATDAETVENRVYLAARATSRRALEFDSEELLEEALDAVKQYAPARSDEFAARAGMAFYRHRGDAKSYLKAAKQYESAVAGDDAKELHQLAKQIRDAFEDDAKAMKYAEQIAERSIKKGADYRYHYTYAEILFLNGRQEAALEAAATALEIAKTAGRGPQRAVEALIRKIG